MMKSGVLVFGAASVIGSASCSPVIQQRFPAPPEDYQDSYALGIEHGAGASASAPRGQWAIGSFVSGLVFGPFGAFVAYALADGADVRFAEQNGGGYDRTEYTAGFGSGVEQGIRSARKRDALNGGVLGTVAAVVAWSVVLTR